MFDKVLIANRGEIAVRVIRACRDLGIASVAVCSAADRGSPAAVLADETVLIGPAPPRQSYLYVPNLVEAAFKTGADAVHPGYGFLSEDPDFAEICAQEGLAFIGPSADVMHELGSKATARRLMADVGLPLLPGSMAPIPTADEALRYASDIGYPVIIKASAGGGGRGMTVVRDARDLREAYVRTRATAGAVFGDSAVYIERFLDAARHVEVQVLADHHGAVVHLGERDCSVQRRHQKLLEEAPSSRLSTQQRAELGALAVHGARAIGYTGAGTMEFVLDPQGSWWFMEMNARIQVEHPVTELVTGIDIVREQIRVAAGEPLGFDQEDVVVRGAALECRVNAEDPQRHFAPTPGTLDVFEPPSGPWTRVDSGYTQGSHVGPHYDSLLAKVVVWAPDRDQALRRMDRALHEFRVDGRGVSTTIDFARSILAHPLFRAGRHDTSFVDHLIAGPGGSLPTASSPTAISTAPRDTRGAPSQKGTSMPAQKFSMPDLMDLLVDKVGLPRNDCTDDSDATFDDVGLDSLAFLQLQLELQSSYGVELADDRPQGYTMGDITAAVQQHLQRADVA